MGLAIANSTNAAQGWRKPLYTPAQMREAGITPSGEVNTMPGNTHSKMAEGTCGGGSWRKKNESNGKRKADKKSRQPSGRMANKHRSPVL